MELTCRSIGPHDCANHLTISPPAESGDSSRRGKEAAQCWNRRYTLKEKGKGELIPIEGSKEWGRHHNLFMRMQAFSKRKHRGRGQ